MHGFGSHTYSMINSENKRVWVASNWNFREDDNDYYTQPGKLFNLMSSEQKTVLFENTARAMGDASEKVKLRHIYNCTQADPEYGKGVAEALGLSAVDAM